ncbi:MAG: aminomethyl-transferring glycine dehydrogenase subunit GcvPB [Albimonas sp.]|uniref:aminomethyl-transferring glycine dehydrogenase subunit GcvPB n=1 Tax=Albimonas sp. TaxID=1872425 RepID=UPI004056A96E
MTVRAFHAARWAEPVVMELGRPGTRGQMFPAPTAEAAAARPAIPAAMRRKSPPKLPELTEFDVQRHFLHLSQMTLGMMHVSLFGTCTMKYNSKAAEFLANRPELAETHPHQHDDTVQGTLQIVHEFGAILNALSGMDQFVFQAGGGADAAYTMCATARAYWAARGELGTRDEVVTSVQAHPCNPATAAAAGFKVINLPLEESGYPSLDALKAAIGPRTAMLMINNPDDMGIYNPDIKEWVKAVKAVGGLCFYDHANFNGVMGKLSARELGFDACMFMLHKTFGAPKGGGGPAVGAFGCTAELAPFMPAPVVVEEGGRYRLDHDRPQSCGKIREFLGNVPQVVKAYAWVRAMGAEGIAAASDISVVANNYMDARLRKVKDLEISNPGVDAPRMEMTRWSLRPLTEATGVGAAHIANRMADYGVDPWWMSHEPWIVAEPFTPEAGELWSREDIDYWIEVLETIIAEAHADPEMVKSAPHRQPVAQVQAEALEEPGGWAMTWRAHLRKRAAPAGGAGQPRSAVASAETRG